MTNTYFKVSKKNLGQESYFNYLEQELKKDFRESINSNLNEDLYSMVSGIQKNKIRPANIDINTLLKYYIINKLMENSEPLIENKSELINTANPNIKVDKDGIFYRVQYNKRVAENNIINVHSDGSYDVQELRVYCSFKIVRTFNIDNQMIKISILNNCGTKITDKWQIAEILNLKQEFRTKYKYSGYSGNSKEIIGKVLNKFHKPLPTGYYMDSNCTIWKWNYQQSCYIRVFEREAELPLMSDIEFKSNGTVIRQEYTGIAS